MKVQIKPVGSESDPNVPIFQYRALVGGTDTVVRLDNLPAGAYTVRAFPESLGRWLRTEGRIVTEAPWIFAAPTGANKVTVYWDEVPGATGVGSDAAMPAIGGELVCKIIRLFSR